jgi:hypothetical protein
MVLVGKAVGHDGHHAQVTMAWWSGIGSSSPTVRRCSEIQALALHHPSAGAEIWEAFD